MTNISIWSILVMTLITLIGGAIWYGPIFGKKWGKMLGYSKLSQKETALIKNEMWKSLLGELSMALTFYIALAYIITITPHHPSIFITLIIWLGLVVPVTASSVLWGGVQRNQIVPRILIMIGFRFIMIMLASFILI